MTTPFAPPDQEGLARVRELSERCLPSAELDAYVRAPWTDAERESTAELIAWFVRR